MALEDLLISTGVDQLIKLVKEKGKVELALASRELKQPIRTIEDWAHVLEEESLISIANRLTKIYLVWKGPTAQYVAEKSEMISEKAAGAQKEVADLLSRVQKGGSELAEMRNEVARTGAARSITPEEAERLKDELTGLSEKYSKVIGASVQKLERLKKNLALLEPKAGRAAKAPPAQKDGDMEKLSSELSALRNFEKTLQSQLEDAETFFGAFETRLGEFRKQLEEGRESEQLIALQNEIEDAKVLKNELDSAIEAVGDEQKSLAERISAMEKRAEALKDGEDSVGGAKRRLAELRKMGEDAKRQKAATMASLADAVSLVKKESSKVSMLISSQQETVQRLQQIKDDYVDISEEIASAQEELRKKQEEASRKIADSVRALNAGKGMAVKVGGEELQKASAMLQEMETAHAALEEKVRGLLKESEILGLQPAENGVAGMREAAAGGEVNGGEEKAAFVERIRLSEEEEGEFERKREELRSLIRRMWEENKGDS